MTGADAPTEHGPWGNEGYCRCGKFRCPEMVREQWDRSIVARHHWACPANEPDRPCHCALAENQP